MPPNEERRPWAEAASETSRGTTVAHHDTRPVVVDPVIVRSLALVVPCALCRDGLCMRCWVVARAVAQLVIAARRDQATDDLVVAA